MAYVCTAVSGVGVEAGGKGGGWMQAEAGSAEQGPLAGGPASAPVDASGAGAEATRPHMIVGPARSSAASSARTGSAIAEDRTPSV
jgi:hypothetical protein